MWWLIKSFLAPAHRKQSGIPTSGGFPLRGAVVTYQISSCVAPLGRHRVSYVEPRGIYGQATGSAVAAMGKLLYAMVAL